ncbi:MAG: DNA topoisomerase IV subunit A, partial [Alphaproteobacteria bacterium]|nr:DNA topoisomerase IV subunit A [Alphaproteobacteria bacterium]
AVDKLPRGRGFGDPIRLSIDLGNEDDILACLLHTPVPEGAPADGGRRLLLASTEGNGFQVAESEVLASTRAGRQIMVLGEGGKARACLPTAGDHVAVLSESRKLLVFPLEQVPAMSKGRGVILQKYKTGGLLKEGLADIAVFALKDGLAVEGGGRRQVFDVKDWIGNRAGQGSTVPKGWPRVAKLR